MLKKGDRVEFTQDGEVKYGVVARGGTKVIVVQDGGEYRVTGPAKAFRPSSRPIERDEPSVMDKWSVKGYEEIRGHGDSPTFFAKIYFNGKMVGSAENNGWGGPNCYHMHSDILADFHEDAKAWVAQFGYADLIEPEDTWVEWYAKERPFGVTAKSLLENYKKSFEAML